MASPVVKQAGLLSGIGAPADLRGLGVGELDQLCAEIRTELVDTISTCGGHLGSNLGAVELTIALHRVFSSPADAIIWDTGHQAYVHKLVTGRVAQFPTLRQRDGLSGYPSRAESAHDLVENSHASTALGYASGLAKAVARDSTDRHVVAVVGDGALTGGLAYEALNNIGYRQLPVILVLNDNGRSYAPTVSRLWGEHGTARQFFEALGWAYTGTVDGHDIAPLEDALCAAARSVGPVVVHALTQKGRGFGPAERDPVKCLHDVGPFDPATGRSSSVPAPTYTGAFGEALVQLGEMRSDIYAVTAAMPSSTGLSAFAERFPDRFIDVGIAEQQAATMAAGLAMGGQRPVVAVYSTFLNRAWDQIYFDVGLHGLPVVFCIDRAGITGDDGASHHGVLDLALLTKVPGMRVLAPSSREDVGEMLRFALTQSGPVAIRWPKGPARVVPPELVGRGEAALRLRAGSDVCVLAVGRMVEASVGAAELLAGEGISASVWDVRSVRPLDRSMLEAAAGHSLVVTVEDGLAEGGAGAHIGTELDSLAGPTPAVHCLGTPLRYLAHGSPQQILADLGLDAAGIAATAGWLLRSAS